MVSDFSRIITLLRKEKGVTQKQAAEDLGVSQALLSHYEKGIRECGLEFVVRVADYYGVSCDYLLGRSADRSGLTLSVEDIPSPEGAKAACSAAAYCPLSTKAHLQQPEYPVRQAERLPGQGPCGRDLRLSDAGRV